MTYQTWIKCWVVFASALVATAPAVVQTSASEPPGTTELAKAAGVSHLAGVQFVTAEPSVTFAQRLAAAIEHSQDHGIVWLAGSEQLVFRGTIAIRKPLTLIVAAPHARFEDGAHIDVLANSVRISGMGRPTVSVGNNAGIRIGAANSPVYDWLVSDLMILPADGRTPDCGLRLESAREGRVERVYASGFSGSGAAAMRILSNSWSNKIRNSYFVRSTRGVDLSGDQINALTLAACNVSWNRIGVYVSGGTMQGLTLTEGTQIEGNDVGVRLAGGTLYGVTLSDTYSECYEDSPLVLARGDGKTPLILNQLTVIGGSIYAKSAGPIRLDSTGGPTDVLQATIVATSFVTSSVGSTAIGIAAGVRARIVSVSSSVVDARKSPKEGTVRTVPGPLGR